MPAKPAEPEITELEVIEPDRVDGVKSAASGFPFLMLKSLPEDEPEAEAEPEGEPAEKSVSEFQPLTEDERAEVLAIIKAINEQGEVDEAPDIANAEHVLTLLGKLIQAEAAEFATGEWAEIHDIGMLSDAACSMMCFLYNEQSEYTYSDDAAYMKSVGEVMKAHRKFSADQRKSLAAEGKALPDGSYPIPDEDALHRAAILARSGHGDVAAAKRLIAKRARELGVANPLEHDASKASGDEEVTGDEGDEAVKAVEQELEDLKKAHGEAIKALEDERDAVKGELAKLKATPIPGGPVIATPAAFAASREQEQSLLKAAEYERAAKTVGDRDLARWYRDEAKRLRGDNG